LLLDFFLNSPIETNDDGGALYGAIAGTIAPTL